MIIAPSIMTPTPSFIIYRCIDHQTIAPSLSLWLQLP